jgi:hypothetical protein
LVVSSNKKKQLVVQLESAAGKTLLSAGPFTDKRSVAGLRRTLKTVLSDSVVYEDRTAKVATVPAVTRAPKVAAASKPANAVEAPIVPARATRTRRQQQTEAK